MEKNDVSPQYTESEEISESVDHETHERHEEIIRTALKRFAIAEEREQAIRQKSLEDIKFSVGDQWDPRIRSARESDDRPCLTINRLSASIHQLTNSQRQNKPAIRVSPVDDKGDIETAKIRQGIIRHIEYASDASTAYMTAFDFAVRGGFGFWRLLTKYTDPLSFTQEPVIEPIENPFSVYLDPSAKKPEGSDANWGFIVEDVSRDEYEIDYPDSKLCTSVGFETIGNQARTWLTSDTYRVAEYIWKEFKEVEIVLLSNGESFERENLPEILPPGIEVTDSRLAKVPKIKWAKINGIEVLEERDIPGSFIPIVRTVGEMINVGGEKVIQGIVRQAQDPQKMYNYQASNEAETIALSPKAPWIVAEGQIEGYESEWEEANKKTLSYLPYRPKTIDGIVVPPPQRNSFEPAVQAITNARMLSADDLKATTGIFDAALGNQSNETSGRAIRNRTMQAETSNYHFVDNFAKAICHTGRILNEWIPEVYDTPRAARILGDEGTDEVVKLNQEFDHKGKSVTYAMDVGKYDVTVSVGPSFETKRQEAAASQLDYLKSVPQIAPIVMDLVAMNQDWPGAQEFAERIRKTMDPKFIGNDKSSQQIPPEVQQQMQQMSGMLEQLTQALNQAQEKIEKDLIAIESKERIEMMKIQSHETIEMAKLGNKNAVIAFQEDMKAVKHRLDLLHANQPIESEIEGTGPLQAEPFEPNEQQPQQPIGGSSPSNSMGEYP